MIGGKNMKYKKMIVWSGGSEKAKLTKINTIGYSACFIMLCVLHIGAFICNPNDNKNIPVTLGEHVLYGMMFVFLLGWLTVLMLFAAKSSFKDIKKNKLISLYLYDIENFAKIGEIPKDKFILFSNENGVVLADKKYEDESRIFSFGAKYFHEFEDYYNKRAVEKIEVTQ